MSANVCSRLTYSNQEPGVDECIEKKLSQNARTARLDHGLHSRSFPQESAKILESDFVRDSNISSRSSAVDSDVKIVPEQRRSRGQGYTLGSQRQPSTNLKRLIPMARPRASSQSVINELKYDNKEKIRRARLLLKKKLERKLERAALVRDFAELKGLQRGGLASVERNTLENLLMRRALQANGRIGRKKLLSEWDREAKLRKMRQYKKLNDLKVLSEARKYRQSLRRGLLTNTEVRRMIEREAASFGEMCSRMSPESVIETRDAQKELQTRRGRHIGMGLPPNQQLHQVNRTEHEESVITKEENINGPWISSNRCTQLPQVPLIVDNVDDRQLVAKEVNSCIQNIRSLLHLSKEILILAESDFSFSSALVDHTPKDSYMIATSFESEEKLEELHKEKLENHLKILRDHNAAILHDVDASQIEETLEASIRRRSPEEQDMIRTSWSGQFDLVWIQLPHTGGTAKTNSLMIQRFLSTVGRVLKPNGLVFMTLYGMQVDHWKVSQHAQAAEMVHVFKVPFNTTIYPAIWTRYNPKVGFSNGYFDILRHPCDTYVFAQNEFTCVSKLKPVDSKILSGLRTVKINTIADLADADKRLLSNDVDPKFIRLIHQAKGWLRDWTELLSKIPQLMQSLPLLDIYRDQEIIHDRHYSGNPIHY